MTFLFSSGDDVVNEQSYRYLTIDEMKSLGDDSLPLDVTREDRYDTTAGMDFRFYVIHLDPCDCTQFFQSILNKAFYFSNYKDSNRDLIYTSQLKKEN